ncbi:MAG: hypothetical protein ACOCY8_04340 [Spirochaetota bacterium]
MKLWDLAGKVYIEAIFRGQVLAAGSNVHRLTQSMKSDSGYATRQGRIVQFLGSFYLLMVAFLSVTAFLQLRAGGAVEGTSSSRAAPSRSSSSSRRATSSC